MKRLQSSNVVFNCWVMLTISNMYVVNKYILPTSLISEQSEQQTFCDWTRLFQKITTQDDNKHFQVGLTVTQLNCSKLSGNDGHPSVVSFAQDLPVAIRRLRFDGFPSLRLGGETGHASGGHYHVGPVVPHEFAEPGGWCLPLVLRNVKTWEQTIALHYIVWNYFELVCCSQTWLLFELLICVQENKRNVN